MGQGPGRSFHIMFCFGGTVVKQLSDFTGFFSGYFFVLGKIKITVCVCVLLGNSP